MRAPRPHRRGCREGCGSARRRRGRSPRRTRARCGTRRRRLEVRPRLDAPLHKQRADGKALRPAGKKALAQVREREAAVEDVLDNQNVTTREVDVEVLQDPHHATGLGRASVGRHGHEVELQRQLDLPGEIGEEYEGALQHPDEQRRSGGVVGCDHPPQLSDPFGDLVDREHDPAQSRVGVPHAHDAGRLGRLSRLGSGSPLVTKIAHFSRD